MQKLYTTKTLAERLDVSPQVIESARYEGHLSCVWVREQVRYRESDIQKYQRYLEERRGHLRVVK